MSFLQSKTISHFQIVLPRENAYRVIGQIGTITISKVASAILNSKASHSNLTKWLSSPRLSFVKNN